MLTLPNFKTIAILATSLILAACEAFGPKGGSFSEANQEVDTPLSGDAAIYRDILVGRYAFSAQDTPKAAEANARAFMRNPDQQILMERALLGFLSSGDIASARAIIRQAEFFGPSVEKDATFMRLIKALQFIKEDQYDAANAYIEADGLGQLSTIFSEPVAMWAKLGADDKDIVPEGESEVARHYDVDDALDDYNYALILIAQDELIEAETILERAVARLPIALGVIDYASLVSARGDNEKAIAILERFLSRAGGNPEIEIALNHLRDGNALSLKGLTPQQGVARVLFMSAAFFASHPESEFVISYLTLAYDMDPEFWAARFLLANILHKSDRTKEALALFETIPETSPYFIPAMTERAWIYYQIGEEDKALENALGVAAANPGWLSTLQLADLLRALREYEAAVPLYTKVLKSGEFPTQTTWRIHYARGACFERLGNWPSAEEDLKKALEIEPDRAQVLNFLGYSWVDRGINLEEGFRLIRRAVELEPGSGYIIDSLGWAYFKQREYFMAVTYLEKAVELTPDDPTINEHLGDAYWRLGREIEARFQWMKALSMEATDEFDRGLVEAKIAHGLDDALEEYASRSSESASP